jgi:hypothetical protein
VSPFKTRKRRAVAAREGQGRLAGEEALQTWFDGPVVVELADLAEEARRKRLRRSAAVPGRQRQQPPRGRRRAARVGRRQPRSRVLRALRTRTRRRRRRGGEGARAARTLRAGRAGAAATAEAWTKWIAEYRDFVFFSDVGGYRWIVDPLAKQRGVSTAQLRGALRVAPAAEQVR